MSNPHSYTIELLREVSELLERYQDTRDGSDGVPLPNDAMLLKRDVEAHIERLSHGPTRSQIIEEVAQSIESAPLTYAGPDPQGVRDLHYLIVCAIRDLKQSSATGESR